MVECLRPQIRDKDGKEHKTQKPGHSMWKSATGRENPRHFPEPSPGFHQEKRDSYRCLICHDSTRVLFSLCRTLVAR